MHNSRFNCIVILDAIPDGELRTARKLHEDLFDYRNANLQQLGQLDFRHYRIATEDELGDCISSLIAEIQTGRLIPWLHLEAHGLEDKTGFATANGVPVSWEQFNRLITPLNILTNLNLVLVLASCYGAYYIQSLRPTQRSPILALVGPIERVLAGDVVKDFMAFYRHILNNRSFGRAAMAIAGTNEGPLYYATNAEEIFLETWKGYRDNHCSNKALKTRALALIQRLRRANPEAVFQIGSIKKVLKEKEPEFFDKYRDVYFLYDIYPSNKARFPITYQMALEYVAH